MTSKLPPNWSNVSDARSSLLRASPVLRVLSLIVLLQFSWCAISFGLERRKGPTSSDRIQRMTYKEAVERIPERRELPDFWISDVEAVDSLVRQIKKGQVQILTRSPGGRPVYLISYGEHEPVEHRANYNSAVAASRSPEIAGTVAYMDKSMRKKPVLFLIGPVHGQETEGLVGLASLISILETGEDLRGHERRELHRLAEQCRLLIIPSGNPDGLARFEPRSLHGMYRADVEFWGQGTWEEHTLIGWPEVKARHPMVGPDVDFLGCYFNDQGVNMMHDEWFAPMAPETKAILDLARLEGPDFAVSLHSHSAPPMFYRPAYAPYGQRQTVRDLLLKYNQTLEENGLEPHPAVFELMENPDGREESFNLVSAVQHTSGANSFLFEAPHGVSDPPFEYYPDHEAILEMHLLLFRSMFEFALAEREPEP